MKIFRTFDRIILFFVPARFLKVCRYLVAGGTAAATDLVLLYIFTALWDIWYLLSAILAFIIAFMVSFTLQKFWTFDDTSEKWKTQAAIYFIITGTNLGLNTLFMYIFVDIWHIHYFISQFVISGLLAFESYFVYQIFVFKKQRPHGESHIATQ